MTAADERTQEPTGRTSTTEDPTTALGRAIARRHGRGHRRLGTLAASSGRFVAGTGRSLVARRALAVRRVGQSLGAPAQAVRAGALEHTSVRAPRWWDVADHTDRQDDAGPTTAGRTARRLPARGLPRVVHAVPDEKPNRPGGVVASAAPRPVPMHLPAEVTASGSMITPQDRRRRSAPASPPTTGAPGASPGKAEETGSRPQAPAGARAGSPQVPPVGPAAAPPARAGQYLRRRALTARTVAAARARAEDRRPRGRHVADARPGGRGHRPGAGTTGTGTTTGGTGTALPGTTPSGGLPSGALPSVVESIGSPAPASVSEPTGLPPGDHPMPVAAPAPTPRPLRRAIGSPVRLRQGSPYAGSRAVSTPVPVDGHGAARSAVRAAPQAHRLIDAGTASAPSTAPTTPPDSAPTTAVGTAPGTGSHAGAATTDPARTPAAPPSTATPAAHTRSTERLPASASAPVRRATSSATTQAATTSSDAPTSTVTDARTSDASPSGSAPAAAPASPPTLTGAKHAAPEVSRTSFSGLPVGITSITGRRTVRRLAAGAPQTVGPRALPARTRPLAGDAPTAHPTSSLATRPAGASSVMSAPAAPDAAPARATGAPHPVTERAASTHAVVGAGGTVAVRASARLAASRPSGPTTPVTGPAGSAGSAGSARPVTTAARSASSGGTMLAVRRLVRSDARAAVNVPPGPPTAQRRGAARVGGRSGGSPLGIGGGTGLGSGGGPSWAGARRGRTSGPGRAAGLATGSVPVVGPRDHGPAAAGPTPRAVTAGPTPATSSPPTVRRTWYTDGGRRRPAESFRPEPWAPRPHSPSDPDHRTWTHTGATPAQLPTSPTGAAATATGPTTTGPTPRTSPTGTVRRSAADGRAVLPPRGAPARPAAAGNPPPAPTAASRAGAAASAAVGTTGPSGPQRLEQALIRRALAEEGTRSPSVPERISHFESLGSQEGSVMSMSSLAPGQPPQVPASAMAFRRDELDDGRSPWDDPDDAVLDTIVDRVVERIEDRVVEEIERRGRHRSPGVF